MLDDIADIRSLAALRQRKRQDALEIIVGVDVCIDVRQPAIELKSVE
ncbi:hypothetical protein [Corynebacterium casei]